MIARLGRSMRARLALLASVAMALLCLVTSSLLLRAVHSTAVDIRTNEVITAALRVVHLIKTHRLPRAISLDLKGLQVIDASGRIVSSTPNLTGSPRLTTVVPDPDNAGRLGEMCDLPRFSGECQIVIAFRVYEPDGDWVVYAFDPMTPWYVHPAALAFLAGGSVALVALTWFGVSRVVARTLTRLEQAMERQRRFASDASHDLRSPITAMRAELEEAMLAPEETNWRKTGDRLLTSLDRLQNIVTDLLTLAKLDACAPGRLDPVDLAELVTAETTRPRSKKVVTVLRPGVVVTADPVRLARLLTNLLDNAERHAETTVTVTVRQDGVRQDGAVLEVLDDGAGIAPEHREMVFRRFTRLDDARNRDAGGTGLGLPIAREIAEGYGGTLTIEDAETGCRFVLRMPARKD